MISYYELFGIPADADDAAITSAYRAKAQAALMDSVLYDEIQVAYETLISPEKRREYDALLASAPVEPTQTLPKTGTAPLRRAQPDQNSGSDTTRAILPITCPVCAQTNSGGETYCTECGFLLSTTPGDLDGVADESGVSAGPRLQDAAGHIYPIKPGLNRVGRESADILILDKTVSRYHGLIVFDEERHIFSVEDAASSNGTRVNDKILAPRASHQLSDGDEVSFGTTKFRLYTGDRAVPAARANGDSFDEGKVEVTIPPSDGVAKARLTLQRGRGPQEVLLVPGTINIGRLTDNQICLAGDRYASGHHAQIVVEESVFRLIDVGSTNGSFLNGLRLTTNESIAMSDGDEIMIGSTVFQFQKIIKNHTEDESDSEPVEAQPVESLPDSDPV